MSKLQWIGCFALAAAVCAPALGADEPVPYPSPRPAAPDTPPNPAPDPAPKSPDYPAPAPAPKAEQNPQYPAPKDDAAPEDDASAPKADTTMPPTADAQTNVSNAATVTWAGQSLRFEQARFNGEARLYARSKDSNTWQVYRGADLDTILRANAALASHPEVAALKTSVAGPAVVRVVVQGANVGFEQEVGGEARLFARGPRGETMWSGTDLAAIAQAHPEVTQLPEWSAFEPRVRAADPAASSLRLRDGVGGVTVITYAPREVVLTTHSWRDRGWQARSYRGTDLQQILRVNPDLSRTMDLGDISIQAPGAPAGQAATTAPVAPRTPGTSSQPAQRPASQQPAPTQPGAYPSATPPTPPAPPAPPAGGGGSACGAGGKNCGK
jgi:hypothetical protein